MAGPAEELSVGGDFEKLRLGRYASAFRGRIGRPERGALR